ncbi:type I-U CRISPR-associated protein Cas7 [Paracoccus bogoriensis]|uniref:type I-G CRISPR-associated RAMP protein Csb1/Cas7g n=1 Tax=Paracoccus bogoriensis TaxID=242065 RepID=UPI001CA5D935|nr:type I-U CRISPR-associated RAMP protein Csb1/Cas7u [Paracoccus bogoriensis]MBW7056294.1 type I-U CRISPR-associated protein Cas7 [Paracoccus bogoriensis]
MQLDEFRQMVAQAAALRRRQRLQPAGGPGDKLFPPTYPGENGPTHVFERRRIDGAERVCVLIDSVQSQANRLEEALLAAAEAGRIRLPRLTVDFPGAGLNSVGPISVLEAPHRIFDAILRDSELAGKRFRDSDLGLRLRQATPADASAILEASPAALVFGAWNSTGEGGGLGAKFARVIVSEIIGVDVPVEETVDRRTGEVRLHSAGRRTGSRIDPLGVPRSIEIFKKEGDWGFDQKELGKAAKKVRPSEINHGNIAPSIEPLGVTCAYALQTQVLTFAGLRRLRFGTDEARNRAGRTYLAALGLVAMLEGNRQGMALRSRCDLVCEGGLAPLELVAFDGSTQEVAIDPDTALRLYEEAFDAARAAGFAPNPEPAILRPTDNLMELVRRSQQKALADEGGEADEG